MATFSNIWSHWTVILGIDDNSKTKDSSLLSARFLYVFTGRNYILTIVTVNNILFGKGIQQNSQIWKHLMMTQYILK